MKTLYFDCFAGASGNMILGGLLSLGVDLHDLKSGVSRLGIAYFDLEVTQVNRSGINAVHVRTVYEEEKTHRHLSDIEKIIGESQLDPSIKDRAISVFRALAEAEARVHGVDIEKVHFHEVGAMDAIIDIVGACIGFELLGIEKFVCSRLHVGSGFVEIAHGKYPVPPPAVAELLKGIPFYSTEVEGELVTPTGAAIIKTVSTEFGELEFTAENLGYGAGTRDYEGFPNVLRMFVGESEGTDSSISGRLTVLEANLDDSTGELLGHLMERAFEGGALDCWFSAIQMKKNRPGTLISILCSNEDREKLIELLYTETSTIGIRSRQIERECLKREVVLLETKFGPVEAKAAFFNGRIVNIKPEFEQLKSITETTGIPLKRVIAEVSAVCAKKYEGARVVGR